ncbi:MAG: hypothetical protein Ct9H300mP14_00850 [Gammaproteobacteria bacterium]|nr:MAG: hypothetical protein Ct9H300mP14_00850 [Gammaproteobacteria bacterium]
MRLPAASGVNPHSDLARDHSGFAVDRLAPVFRIATAFLNPVLKCLAKLLERNSTNDIRNNQITILPRKNPALAVAMLPWVTSAAYKV